MNAFFALLAPLNHSWREHRQEHAEDRAMRAAKALWTLRRDTAQTDNERNDAIDALRVLETPT